MTERLFIVEGDKPVAVIISMSEYRKLLEALGDNESLELLDKKVGNVNTTGFSFDWEGGLSDLNVTSLDLQHKNMSV